MTEPTSNKDKLLYLLKVEELDDKAIEQVTKIIRLLTLLHLGMVTEESFKEAFKEDVFGKGDISTIMTLKAWIEYLKKENDGKLPMVWVNEVMNEKLFNFAVNQPDKTPKATKSEIHTPTNRIITPTMSNPKMADYPQFSGRMKDWYKFKYQFEGTAQGQSLVWVLVSHADNIATLKDDTFSGAFCLYILSIEVQLH
jgi:hypothetical protein